MPLHLTTTDPDFERAFQAFLGAKRESSEDVDAAVRTIIADVRRRGDAALIELTPALRWARPRQGRHPRQRGGDRGGGRGQRQGCARRAGAGAVAHREPPPAAAAARRALHRRGRSRARLALDGGGIGRPLCARRPCQLSELGADERRAGPGRRRAAHRHGRARAARGDQSRWCWRRRTWRASPRSTASAGPRRSPRWPMAPRRCSRSPRSSGRAMPMSPPPSARCSGWSASTPSPGRPRCW